MGVTQKRAGRHFGFLKRAGRHQKAAGRPALRKRPRQNTALPKPTYVRLKRDATRVLIPFLAHTFQVVYVSAEPALRSRRHGGYYFRARKLTNSWITRGTSQVAVKRKPAVNFMIVFRRMLVQRGKFCVRSMVMKGSAEQ